MDAGRLDRAHHLDGAGEFALERSQPRHVLHERGEAEGAQLVEQLVADRAAARQALFGQEHARGRGLAGRDEHRGALGVDVEGDARLAQGGADRRDVVASEAGVKRLHGGAAELVAGEAGDGDDREPDQPEREEAPETQTEKVGPQPFRMR